MISKTQCPHTGVLNFFMAADPLLAVGSVIEAAAPAGYSWHCYLDDPVAGTALDLAVAEAELRRAITQRRDHFARAV